MPEAPDGRLLFLPEIYNGIAFDEELATRPQNLNVADSQPPMVPRSSIKLAALIVPPRADAERKGPKIGWATLPAGWAR